MVMTPARVAELTNGYEQRTSGLWTHKGKADIGTLRVTNNLTGPGTGVGVEFGYNPSPLDYGFIQAYDRDLNQWRDLYLSGKNVFLNPQGGVVNMPANTVGTAQIQANAVQQLLGSYQGAPTWSTTTTGWNVTPVSVSVTSGGGLLRIEWCTTFTHSVAATIAQVGIGWAGAVQIGLQMCSFVTANELVTTSGCHYAALAAGAQTIQMFVYMYAAGTLSISTGVNSTLFVTEQKR